MTSQLENLKPYNQTRWVCATHGFFDVRLSQNLPNFKAKCPTCQKPAVKREGYECTGRTTGPVPYSTKPRLEEVPEVQFVASDKAPVRQQGKRW